MIPWYKGRPVFEAGHPSHFLPSDLPLSLVIPLTSFRDVEDTSHSSPSPSSSFTPYLVHPNNALALMGYDDPSSTGAFIKQFTQNQNRKQTNNDA